ncbi:MAG: DUF2490 domain-containing protein [Cyclobacteriaceae bacterium]|nr:DUF2490 domain-containing protein [Cyclobacteriaceae bacterium]
MKFSTTIKLTLVVIGLLISPLIYSQNREVTEDSRIWFGYMTSTQINSRYSWWNDFHYVPEGFFVLRTGITRHLTNTAITAGYGHLWLPVSTANTVLQRHEYRPWAQIQFNLPVTHHFALLQRVRYDARFIQDIRNEQPVDEFTFTNRIRFLTSLKLTWGNPANEIIIPYVAVSNEVLLNFGESVTWNTFNQNRASLMVGLQKKNIQLQSGYMNMFIQTGDNRFTSYHTLVLWVFHKFKMTEKKMKRGEIIHN